MEHLNFNYNIAINTINCINDIDYTYHIIRTDYPTIHTHDDYYEFTIILEGEILNFKNGIKEKLSKKTLFISGPSESHYIKKIKGEIKILNIIVRSSALMKLINDLFPSNFLDFFQMNKNFLLENDLIHLIEKNINAVNVVASKDWKLTDALLKSTVILILNNLFLKSIDYTEKESGKYGKIINKLNDLKSSTRLFTMGVNDLCYEFDFSRTHLNRVFNELFKLSPYEYLLKVKMEYAASLLLYTDYSIKEICNLVGYSSTLRFSHNFREIYNYSPYEYRKK